LLLPKEDSNQSEKSSRLSEFDHFPGTDGRSQIEGLGISRERGITFSGVLPFGVEEWVS
jgi:hypothetical protein